ncbi:MAG: polyprenyl synthetase family protein [bacterium]|nr:MAG: polyprenyl synthetase family protein [bacterium]
MSLGSFLDAQRQAVDEALEACMPGEDSYPARLVAAMRYSLFAGGKRIRPVLVMAAAQAAGGKATDAMPAACAVELVHTYSLIHDDLPAMDDDDFRRGRPTCHRAFDEATAILAGDALLTMAFELLSLPSGRITPATRIRMVEELSRAAGWRGMVGGQQVDMESEGAAVELPVLEYIHTHKTGAMIRCCLILGGLSAGASRATLRALTRFGEKVGLAFQIVDDILDVTSTTEEMGKDQGSDARRGKATYTALFGLDEARRRAVELVEDARTEVAKVDSKGILGQIADYILLRRL